MLRIIDGKNYNTKTARELCELDSVADVGLKIAGAAICKTRSNVMTKTKNDITPIFQALSLGFIAGMLFAISLYAWADYIFGRGVH
jgi:hypothetical protein